jgi:tetratricopeptide (TPR) repeat protein
MTTPHVQAALATVPEDDVETLTRILAVGLRSFAYLVFADRYGEADKLVATLVERSSGLDLDNPVHLSIRHRHTLLDNSLTIAEERAAYREILDRQLAVLGPNHPDVLITDHNWVSTFAAEDPEWTEAELRRVVANRTLVLGATNPYSLLSRRSRVNVLTMVGRDDEAEAELHAIVADCRRERGEVDHETIISRTSLANLMLVRGHSERSNAEYGSVAEYYGTGDLVTGSNLATGARHQLAHALSKVGRHADAEVEYRAVLDTMAVDGEMKSSEYRHLSRWLGRSLRGQDRHEESLAHFETLIADCADLDETDADLLSLRHDYGDGLDSAGKLNEAEEVMTAVLSLRGDGSDSIALQERHCRAHVLQKMNRLDEAEADLKLVSSTFEQSVGPEAEPTRRATWCHAMALLRLDRLAEALARMEKCLAAELTALGGESRDALVSRRHIAETRFRLGLTDAAGTRTELEAILPDLITHDGEDGRVVVALRRLLDGLDG